MTASRTSIAEKVARAEQVLGHTFADQALIRRAITHPSAVTGLTADSFERLEFLGDSIVSAIIAEEVYRRFPELPEGGLTRIRVSVVAGPVLAAVAADTGLGDALVLGESELKAGGRGRTSALEDVYEATVAALYLDAGIDEARRWVLDTLGPRISADSASLPENPKSLLQELAQARGHTPVYQITGQDGPPHDRCFTAVVELAGLPAGEGRGRTKREAEAAAAAAALAALDLG